MVGLVSSLYLGYVLLIFITLLPEALVIIIEELNMNML